MAKITHDREDLLRDGTAMPIRGRYRFDGFELVVGWRTDGSCSWFCDLDPVFQFNAQGQLRRVFRDGNRLSSEGGRLCQLVRRGGSGDRVELVRAPISEAETSEAMAAWQLWRRRAERPDGDLQIDAVGVSTNDFREKLIAWLGQIPEIPTIADTPGV